ncbi:c-type cytochrome [Balneola sp. MJW-20]
MKNLNSMNIKGLVKAAGIFVIGITMSACQGQLSEKPPIHPNMNMDQQPRKEAQEVNNFFEDGRSMRQPVEGTVARGLNKTDSEYYRGEDENGDWVEEMPIAMTRDLIYRGKERYEIYCTPCHGKTGDGRGIIMTGQYGYVPAPSYHIERLQNAPDGELYSAIYNGVRSMPSYATQVKVEDRWAIVAYIRALQASQNVREVEMEEYGVNIAALQEEYAAEQARQDSLIAARTPEEAPEASVELGMNVVQANGCAACHNVSGEPNGIGPTWAGLYGSEAEVVTSEGETITITKDEDYIYESIVMPEAKKTVGYEMGVMAPYDYLPEHELQSLVLYIKSLSDN